MPMLAAGAFTGIGGFDLGFSRAGIQTHTQIEWDKACQLILRRHFPGALLLGDISDITRAHLGGDRIDLWHGGFPCQDTSIAAPHRSGLAGRRSGHFFEYARLIGETSPQWVVLENPRNPQVQRRTGPCHHHRHPGRPRVWVGVPDGGRTTPRNAPATPSSPPGRTSWRRPPTRVGSSG